MPPKKASKPNAFSLFAQDLMKKQGNKYKSMKEACEGAAPLWANMSPDQKQPYERMAKGIRGQPTRYTSEGLSVDQLTQQFSMKNEAEGKARADIRCIVENARQRKVLDTETFFFVHCNVFCYHDSSDRYWPAEISVLAFNIREGVKPGNIFHRMIKPGVLPLGYAFTAKQHAQETHMIDLPDDNQQPNTHEVYLELRAFLEKKSPQGSPRMPILYTIKKHTKVVQHILNTWVMDYEQDATPNMFNVYELQVLLFHLKNAVAGDEVWTSITFSDREIDKDVYAYVPEIACEFHAMSEKFIYCSRSIVCRYAFIACDNCCPDLNIEVIEGQHVPVNSVIPDSISSGSFSSRRSQSSLRSDVSSECDTNSEIWETESVGSQMSDLSLMSNSEDDFPTLNSRSQSRASNYSGKSVDKPVGRSYAGAIGRSGLPPTVESSLSKRGAPRWTSGNDSDYGATGTESLDFPPISRGRGFRRMTPRKPGPGGDTY